MVIGLTGQIGGGKSTAASIFAELGAAVIDADKIGHQVVRDSSALRKRLAAAFGSDIFDSRGALKRKLLARRAFATPAGKKKLDRLVHPYLLRELRQQMKAALKKQHLVVIDAALLLQWGMDREVDQVLVVHAGRETRISRLEKRGITRADAIARERSQLSYEAFRARADRVIFNNGSPAQLRGKLIAWLEKILPDFN